MSDFTSKDHKGLLEAYHSIYNKKEEVVEELNESVEETLTEDYDVNILLENVKDYLVLRGYVDTEDQAYNIMLHMTEQFFGTLIGEMHVIGTCISMKEHLISEGCEVEDYTIEDMLNLFEYYEKENINEVVGVAAAAAPYVIPAAAAAIGGLGMYLQSRKKQPAKPVDYGQVKADIDAKEKEKAKNKPLSKKQQREAERRAAREQGSQTPAPSRARTQNQPSSGETAGKPPASSSSSTPAPAPTPTPTPQPPKPPKPPKGPGAFAKIGDKFNKAMQNLQKSNQAPPTSTTTPGYIKNLPASSRAILRNTRTLATGAKNLMFGKKGASFIDRFGRTSATSGALGAEFAASKRDPAGPSIAGQTTANIIGGTGNVVNQSGRLFNQIFPGMTGTERTGQDIKDIGQKISDADKGKLNKKKNNSGFKVNPDGTFTYN